MAHAVTTPNALDRFLPATTRKWIHGLLPAITVVLISFGYDENVVGLWIAAVAAALGLGIAAFNSTSALRTWIYGLLIQAQALVVYFGVFSDNQAGALVTLIATLVGQGVAAANTPAGYVEADEPVIVTPAPDTEASRDLPWSEPRSSES